MSDSVDKIKREIQDPIEGEGQPVQRDLFDNHVVPELDANEENVSVSDVPINQVKVSPCEDPMLASSTDLWDRVNGVNVCPKMLMNAALRRTDVRYPVYASRRVPGTEGDMYCLATIEVPDCEATPARMFSVVAVGRSKKEAERYCARQLLKKLLEEGILKIQQDGRPVYWQTTSSDSADEPTSSASCSSPSPVPPQEGDAISTVGPKTSSDSADEPTSSASCSSPSPVPPQEGDAISTVDPKKVKCEPQDDEESDGAPSNKKMKIAECETQKTEAEFRKAEDHLKNAEAVFEKAKSEFKKAEDELKKAEYELKEAECRRAEALFAKIYEEYRKAKEA